MKVAILIFLTVTALATVYAAKAEFVYPRYQPRVHFESPNTTITCEYYRGSYTWICGVHKVPFPDATVIAYDIQCNADNDMSVMGGAVCKIDYTLYNKHAEVIYNGTIK